MLYKLTARALAFKASREEAFTRRMEGANLVEYMLIALLVAVAAIAALQALGVNIRNVINRIVNTLKS